MADRDYDDDRGAPFWLIALLFLVILLLGFLAWRWWSEPKTDPPLAIEEIYDPSDVGVAGKPDPFPGPDPAPVVEPAPPPAPIPDLPPPAVRDTITHTVYFELTEWRLTPHADAALDALLDDFRPREVTRLRIDGHTDSAGAKTYNAQLSMRRAQTVRRWFIDHGVPRQRIEIAGYGEERLASPTPDGVREPDNRRAEVVINFD